MDYDDYLSMTCEIAEECLCKLYEGREVGPYAIQDDGSMLYTDEAQQTFNRLLDDVTDITRTYIKVTGA